MAVVGLDIGGANIKVALRDGRVYSQTFELWKSPDGLPSALAGILPRCHPFDALAVTMTGELCDCFATKREGVERILDAVEFAAAGKPIRVWQTTGRFVDPWRARKSPLQTASANWHALATWAGRQVPDDPSLLIDIGSTTTDIIPLHNGKPVPKGLTDRARLENRELIYSGIRRTPLCALMGAEGAAEWFATTCDVYLVLGQIAEDPTSRATADGRPATAEYAHARLARMWCADAETCTVSESIGLARQLALRQARLVREAIAHVAGSMSGHVKSIIVSGSGEFLAQTSLNLPPPWPDRVVSLSRLLGAGPSEAACAYALAVLGED